MRNFIKNTSGNVITTTALLMVPIILFAGSAVDYSQFARKKTTLQNVVDSAALAVSHDLKQKTQNEIESDVDDFLRSNLSKEQYSEINDVEITIPAAKQKITVTVDSSHPTTLMQIAGIDKLSYMPSSTVSAPTGNIEIMMVLDTTGSMGQDNKINDLKASANNFIETLLPLNTTPDKVKIGIVPFANYVNVGTNNRNEDWINVPANNGGNVWTGCVGSRTASRNLTDSDYSFKVPGVLGECTTPITELTTDETTLKNGISALTPKFATFIAPGLIWGQRSLSSKAPFTNGSDVSGTQKIIVLMTDGDNTISVGPRDFRLHSREQVPAGSGLSQAEIIAATNVFRAEAQARADDITETVCTNIKTEGVRIFTIGFGDGISNSTLRLLQNCADEVDNYYAAADGAALNQAFTDIGSEISGIFLSN